MQRCFFKYDLYAHTENTITNTYVEIEETIQKVDKETCYATLYNISFLKILKKKPKQYTIIHVKKLPTEEKVII